MSNRPTAAWWASRPPVTVSTPDNSRICAAGPVAGRGHCGRRSAPIVDVRVKAEAARVTCADCVAAARADAAAR